MTINNVQRKQVEENMGLVGKVIKDRVHGMNGLGIYTYDDLFQIGCIGLCKAAATDKGGCFSTYAYRLIWNEICSALIYANRRAGKEIPTEPEILSTYEAEIVPEQSDNAHCSARRSRAQRRRRDSEGHPRPAPHGRRLHRARDRRADGSESEQRDRLGVTR